ncbi:MAG TPA: GNAT family N-acetyltransferase [Aggregatilineales bacterium]|nr:GNAT family N-acetyltransferase [Anaerolineales bacterium]HRE46141.1 GNAT family N-acetyltransferase [Aggregatilineales bacterium]
MTTQETVSLHVRPATMDDVEAIVDVLNAAQTADGGDPITSAEDAKREWEDPMTNLTTDTFILATAEGRVVAYGDVFDKREPLTRVYHFGRVHPDFWGQGVGTRLLQILEERAHQSIPKAPPHARIAFSSSVDNRCLGSAKLLQDNGYTLVRRYLQMRIELNQVIPAPVVPEGITIRAFRPGEDDRPLFDAHSEAFQDHWGYQPMPYEQFEHHFYKGEKVDPAIYFLAVEGNQIAGYSLCLNEIPDDLDMGWIDLVGVRRPWRKKGVASALLRASFLALQARGKKRAGLGVDASSLTDATRVYTNVGMASHHEWHRYEKEIRAGEDLAVQTIE